MTEQFSSHPELAEILKYKPFPIPDPVPPWIFRHLDKQQLIRLALIDLKMRNELMEASMKANNQALEILKGIAK